MAVKYATGTGNWSDSTKWNGGALPLAGDTVYANNYTITVDINVNLGGAGYDYDVGPDECVPGGYYTIKTVGDTNWVAMGAAGNVAGTRFLCTASGTGSGIGTTTGTIVNGALASPAITAGGSFILGANTTLRADVENTGVGGNQAVMTVPSSSPSESWWYGTTWGGSGGSNRNGIFHNGSGTFNATGTFYGGTAVGCLGLSCTSSGRTRITGSAYGRTGSAISVTGTGIIELALTDCVGSKTASVNGFTISSSAVVYGSISNALGGDWLDARGFVSSGASSTISITGVATAGSLANTNGILLSGNSTLIFTGIAIGSSAAVAASNTSAGGSLRVTRAVGAPSGTFAGLNGTNLTAVTTFKEAEFGAQGAPPTSGFCFLEYDAVNGNSVTVRESSGGSFKTFVDAVRIPNAVPSDGDVRNGVTYNFGNNTGTCIVPSASSVAAGVPVDNTIGTAVLTPESVQAIVGAAVAAAVTD